MKRLATLVVAVSFVWPAAAGAQSYTARTLSDGHVGKTRTELAAQIAYSTAVLSEIDRHGAWRYAPRHADCWSHVPWAKLCDRVRSRLLAHRWLRRVALERRRRLYPPPPAPTPDAYEGGGWAEFSCIHGYEGAANANTGNGYHGGLQMDWAFMRAYGSEYVRRWGGAENWPVWAQVSAARRARDSGRGYTPWPNTARMCGQL